MKKGDKILIIAVAVAAVIAFIMIKLQGNEDGSQVKITVDGEVVGTYSLDEDQIIEVDRETGYNRICIQSHKVSMEDADCPDRYCVKQGKIKKENETIVCLPHKLVVEITNLQEDSYHLPDAVAK